MSKANNQNTYCVIMAGGIGSRFWPFSRNSRPKQFLDFFGTGRSLLRMTIDRFRPLVPIENVIVVTNVQYKAQVMEQIPDLRPEQILCEPARRNTAPCIAYAVSYIKALRMRRAVADGSMPEWNGNDLSHPAFDANIIVAPSDHLILQEAVFQQVIADGLDFVASHDAILTLGMKPTRPETGYGYIQMEMDPEGAATGDIRKVRTFTEKPNAELAKVFMDSGEFLWNSGLFLWNLRTICSAFHSFLPEIAAIFHEGEPYMGTDQEDAFIQTKFPTCPNISIDYGVMEKAQNVYVKPADFGWSDLGNWGSLYDLSQHDDHRNVTLHCDSAFYESEGNIVALEEGKLAVVQGLSDMIIAEQGNVLLICPRSQEQHIRQIVNDTAERFGDQFN